MGDFINTLAETVIEEAAPQYGKRLLIEIIQDVATKDPSRPFAFVPRTSDPRDGWKALSFKDVSDAVDSIAWTITQSYGPGFQGQFPTLAYIGANDVRYSIIMMGCIKAGYQALFLSPRNSKEAQHALLKANNCRLFWYTENFETVVKGLAQDHEMEMALVPAVDDLISSRPSPFPYHRTFEEGKWDPAVVLHTSGSTGLPKSLVVRQGAFATADALRNLPDFHGSRTLIETWSQANKYFLTFPLFHSAGIMFLHVFCIFYDTPVVLGFPDRPMDADLAAQCVEMSEAEGAIVVPAVLEEMSKNKKTIEILARLKFVGFGGGSLGQRAAQVLAENGVILCNKVASTEWIPYPIYFQPNINNWRYFIFNSDLMGCKWRLHSKEENLYELVFCRKDLENVKDPGAQAIFYTFPHLNEWSTQDLYTPHPTLPDHWAYGGRVDDILVFSNGENFTPMTLEGIIVSHPLVKGALVVGQGRFQPAVILEPASPCEDEESKKHLIDEVWSLVEEANSETVAHGRLVKWLALVTPPEKPLLRAGKGTILRAANNKQFSEEIDLLYKNQRIGQDKSVRLNLDDAQALAASIVELVTGIAGFGAIESDTDFFRLGLDSLQVISATRMLNIGLQNAGVDLDPQLQPRIIYENPTAQRLSSAILRVVKKEDSDSSLSPKTQDSDLQELLSKYTAEIPSPSPAKPEPQSEAQTILLTGTTGSLGSQLLDRLCKLDTVAKIIALNRGADGGGSRQPSASQARGLDTNFSKVEFLGGDLSLPDFGLGAAKYNTLLSTVDRVIHNAWPVNFNIGVLSFEPHIRGVRHLVNFASAATKKMPIIFLSSIGTAAGWTETRPVPEERLEDFALARMGYGQSKLVSSLILDAACKQGIPAASIRIGQIAGSKHNKGKWNPQEYIPSLIASSVHLGALPDHLGANQVVDWVSVEDVTSLILDVAGITTKIPTSEISGYFHAVNPNHVEWSQLVPAIQSYCGTKIQELVSLGEWVSLLEKSAQNADEVSKNPGLKLLDTYRAMLAAQLDGKSHVAFSMQRTSAVSPAVAEMNEITPDLMTSWCDQWEV